MRTESGMRRRRTGRGFTVLELMIVIFIAVVLFALAAGGLIGTMRAGRSEINRTGRVMSARLLMEHLVRDIESAFPYRAPETGTVVFRGVDVGLEQGAADQLTLVRPKLGAAVPTELEQVTYSVRQRENEQGIQQVVVVSRDPVGRPTAVREVVLGLIEPTSNVMLDLAYRAPGAEGTAWAPVWEPGEGLPEAVRVHLELTDSRLPGSVEFETVVYLHSGRIEGATP